MFVIKPITAENARIIERFMSNDLLGITSLPRNKHFLHQKLLTSLSSFSKEIAFPHDEQYYFVLENIRTGEVGGICGIESKTGLDLPTYSFRIEKIPAPDIDLPVPRKQLVLHFHAQANGPTEIGSLYILPSFRKEGLGRLLSLSRFLFMASFPQRFDTKVVAEMRGFVDDSKKCPFWEGLGRHFLDLEFEDLMNLVDDIKGSIPMIVPQHPVYASLLSIDAQDAIGKVHLDTQPALNMLIQEGFTLTNEVDLFDGGPKIEVPTSAIRIFKQSRVATIQELSDTPLESERFMISNNRLSHCTCYGTLTLVDANTAILPAEVAHALNVGRGDQIRYAQASPETTAKENKT